MSNIKYVVFTLLALSISACATQGNLQGSNNISDDQIDLVTRDFVSALSKLRGYQPRETTIQFYQPNTVFEQKMHDTVRGAGYGIQLIAKDEIATNLLTYESDKYESSKASGVAYEVSIGKVTLGREYEIRTGRIFPITALSVRGKTSSTSNVIDNEIFTDKTEDVAFEPIPNKSIIIGDESEALANRDLNDMQNQYSEFVPVGPKMNMAKIGSSNFESLFDQYKPVRKTTLVFPNDSLRLGQDNKKTIASFARQFDPATDVLSVIGCSHGTTKIVNGNALLANGRASRVKEELIMSKIEPERILDEGCWAAEKFGNMPARGVVLTLRTKSKRG